MTLRERWHDRRGPSESGQAAGIESIPFGILVFVGGMLLVVNTWAAVDTRAALDGAARDYLRAYTSSPDRASALASGRAAASASMSARRSGERLRITDPEQAFGPCRPATVHLEVDLPAINAHFIGSIGTRTISATQTELVQPFGRARDESTLPPSACDG